MRTSAASGRRRRRPVGRMWLVALGIILFFGLTSLRGIAGFYTTYLWFDELGLTSVWSGVLGSKIILAAVFTTFFFCALLFNLIIADRIAPRFRAMGPEDELVQRYRQVVGPHAGKVRLGVAFLFALLAGTGVSAQWQNWLLFQNSVDFGVKDPQFGRDIGFFVFRLPFLSFLVDWAFVTVVIVLVISLVAHYLNGGIRIQAPIQRVTPQVKAHVSVLLGVLALIKAIGYWLQRFELSFSTRGFVDGASFTDVKAQLPALELLVFISLAAGVLFLANIKRQGWVLPIIGVGLWAFISVVVGAIYPAFVQKFQVEPAEIRKERAYIERNIAATREAFDIEDVEETAFKYNEEFTPSDVTNYADTIRNVRLWDPVYAEDTYRKLQELRPYYQLADVDIDRYLVNNRITQTLISARELNPDDIPSQSWVNRHLSYTHGFGAVAAPANAVTSDGQPDFSLREIPPAGTPELKEPRIYYGERTGGYAVVNSKQREIDYQQQDGTTRFSSYGGRGGVRLSSVVRRAAFALRFADVNMLISDLVTPNSRAIFIRNIGDRVRTAAPFLKYDADPYPVIVDGRLLWVQDAYTTTSRYPYSQRVNVDRIPETSGLRSGFNYVRNSVKVVIDAYHGSMTFYVVDDDDPIVKAYAKAFPRMFTPGTEMRDELRAHLRYPEDLFRVQTNMYARYHITVPNEFYNGGDAWDISADPGSGAPATQQETTSNNTTTTVVGLVQSGDDRKRMDPTYLLLRLPGDEEESFLILQPFVPRSSGGRQQNLSAFMTAKSGPGQYGKLQVFVMPRGEQVDGPSLVDARAAADPNVSREITFLNQQGSQVRLGNIQVIPIEDSLLYVRPLYVQSARNPLPEFKRAIVVSGTTVVIAETLRAALTELFGVAPETLEEGTGDGEETPVDPVAPGPDGDVVVSDAARRLLTEANTAFEAGQAALREGNLAEYQKQIEIVGEKVRQARTTVGDASATTTTTTTAPASTTTTAPTA